MDHEKKTFAPSHAAATAIQSIQKTRKAASERVRARRAQYDHQ